MAAAVTRVVATAAGGTAAIADPSRLASTPASFTLASYNILADAYVRRQFYPAVTPAALDPASRRARLLAYLPRLEADVLCLQEVEPPVFDEVQRALAPAGYSGAYARKGRKPDGVAVLARRLVVEATSTVTFDDGLEDAAPSGHVALLATLRAGDRRVVVACTHLLWDAPGTPPPHQRGARELTQLLDVLTADGQPAARVVCGDFNAEPDSHALALARERGFLDGVVDGPTCNSGQRAKRIDYLLYTVALVAAAAPTTTIEDHTPLPSEREPSDHVPVMARFTWA